ncbi:MAG: deoxyribose-phosphate aldolase [Mycoplasmoidaceae bacterium]
MEINKYLEATNLSSTCSENDIKILVEEVLENKYHGICVNPCNVELVRQLIPRDSKIKIVTVVGFPLGQNTTDVKVYETLNAIRYGVDEIDMVMNISKFKEGNIDYCLDEINQIKNSSNSSIVKVIVESGLLSDEENIKVCEMVKLSKADYIKTSTGFSPIGARENIISKWKEILRGSNIKIKASGGIDSFLKCKRMIEAGADVIGTSKSMKIINEILELEILKDNAKNKRENEIFLYKNEYGEFVDELIENQVDENSLSDINNIDNTNKSIYKIDNKENDDKQEDSTNNKIESKDKDIILEPIEIIIEKEEE